jgi:hypothetical protein
MRGVYERSVSKECTEEGMSGVNERSVERRG